MTGGVIAGLIVAGLLFLLFLAFGIIVGSMTSGLCFGLTMAAHAQDNQKERYNDRYEIHVTHLGDDYVRYNDGKCYGD